MGKRYLIDSNAVIDFLGGRLPESGKQWMLHIVPEISIITCIEILSKKELAATELARYHSFINASYVYSELKSAIAEETINLRKNYSIKIPDAIIAATAIVHQLTLITRNEKDFVKIPNLEIVNPWNV